MTQYTVESSGIPLLNTQDPLTAALPWALEVNRALFKSLHQTSASFLPPDLTGESCSPETEAIRHAARPAAAIDGALPALDQFCQPCLHRNSSYFKRNANLYSVVKYEWPGAQIQVATNTIF